MYNFLDADNIKMEDKTMTNEHIILTESIKLMKAGKLEGSGRFVNLATIGQQLFEIPEEIHTRTSWKALGFTVKRGEKAIAKFPIWKCTKTKVNGSDDEYKEVRFLQTSSFFKTSQVQSISTMYKP